MSYCTKNKVNLQGEKNMVGSMLVDFTVNKEDLNASLAMTKVSKTWSLRDHIVTKSNCIELLKYALIVSNNSDFIADMNNFLEDGYLSDGERKISFYKDAKIWEYKIKIKDGEVENEELWLYGVTKFAKSKFMFSRNGNKLDLDKRFTKRLLGLPRYGVKNFLEVCLEKKSETFFKMVNSQFGFGLQFPKVKFVWLNEHPLINRKEAKQEMESNSQIIFLTHDPLMMDSELFRKDEIWFFDKKEKNNIYSLAEFKDIREDLVFSKAYLHGRFGGLPE